MIGMESRTACFTGHRELPTDDLPEISKRLEDTLVKLIEQGYRYFGAGGALGFDYEKKNVMRSKSSDKRRIHTEYRKHFA